MLPTAQPCESLTPFWTRGAALLHQQCWCWGQDIRRSEGNLLLAYGFTRDRPPEGMRGSSRYTLVEGAGPQITLWGFGVGYAQRACGAIYVNRYCFVPRWACEAELFGSVWHVDQLAHLPRPPARRSIRRSRRLLRSLMRWVAGYERWVIQTCGAAYRERTLQEWHAPVSPPQAMALEWELLARHVEEPPP